MHALLAATRLLLATFAGAIGLVALRRIRGWRARRDTQLLILVAPLASLALGVAGVLHFVGEVCWLGAPPWDYTLGVLLLFSVGLLALVGLALGALRLALMGRFLALASHPVGSDLQALVDTFSARIGGPATRVHLCVYGRPLALACGVRRPVLLLSTWLVDHLDRRELEAVVAHELGHIARRDFLVTWLAGMLRDAFFYLPTSRAAFRQLRHDNELASDDLAVAATGRPLALASALAKVWQQALGPAEPLVGGAPALVGTTTGAGGVGMIEQRIERLMGCAPVEPPRSGRRSGPGSVGMGASALGGLLVLQAATSAAILAPMACDPNGPLVALLARVL